MTVETLCCPDCGEELDGEGDICEQCESDDWYERTNKCQLCNERVEEADTSDFILVKAELGETGYRPPGIYLVVSRPFLSIPMIGSGSLHGDDIVFVDKLPEFDHHYEISGHICRDCAKPYGKTCRKVYGKKIKKYDDKQWNKERDHTRKVILANPDMLRDLECDAVDGYGPDGKHIDYANASAWESLKKLYDMPDLPTFHEWVFVEHCGVKVFHDYGVDYQGNHAGWLSLSPEPRFRQGGRHPTQFAPSGLPTHRPYDENDSSRRYYHEREDAVEAVKLAIEQGLIRQDGTFAADGKPAHYG